jgi:prepilin-type N-terminal cleavage/methylation domain-containing protein
MKKLLKSTTGFSLVELLLVIALFALLFSASTVVFGALASRQSLQTEGERVVQTLREARTYALSQRLDSAWGVYLDTASDPQAFILFKGSSYAGRDAAYDQVNALFPSVHYGALNLGGAFEIVFSKRTGSALTSGTFELATEDVLTVSVNPLGFIDYVSPEF